MSNVQINALIGERDSGKTTFLLQKAEQSIKLHTPLLIIDSATEHKEKSLLIKLSKKYDATIVKSPSEIVIQGYVNGDVDNIYPYRIIKDAFSAEKCPLILADVSFYLEMGHRVAEVDKARIRCLYKLLALQILQIFLEIVDSSVKVDVIMDEIETTGDYNKLFQKMCNHNLTVWASAHSLSAFAPVYNYAKIFTIHNYRIKYNENTKPLQNCFSDK